MHSVEELNALDSSTETIIVDNNGCNDRSFTVLNLGQFANLRVLEIGDYSFSYVNEVYLTGLSKLESVTIGDYCFSQKRDQPSYDTVKGFHLKNCEQLRELKMGRWSFNDFSVIEIENVDSLEVIEMGELNTKSINFKYASLELKSAFDGMK